MIIAVDGTSGSGKSTIAKILAKNLNYDLLNTGLLYRKITKECITRNISYSEITKIIDLCNTISFTKIMEEDLHKEEISKAVPYYSKQEEIRNHIRIIQRKIVNNNKNFVVEGRDIGTIVFPEAEIKLYIDASLEERAKRRLNQINEYNENDLRQVMDNLEIRDNHDINRQNSPLKMHQDAILIDTTNKTIDQVISLIMGKIA